MTKKRSVSRSVVSGKFVGNERGFGFVLREGGEDIFIPPHSTFGALHGDEVVCKIEKQEKTEDGNRQSGKITEITKRAPFIGTYFYENGQGYVRAVENKIPYFFSVPLKSINRFGLADGHRVIFSVDKRHKPDEKQTPCFITEVLGHINDPGVDVLTLVRMAGVPYEFPEEVLREITEIPSEITEIENREDFRGEYLFTIDGDDTKDIDDAVSFEKTQDGYRLGVHIADVTHYVRENSALDISALSRGTSIYLADRVIPMLPHALSSGICSLFPNVDRFALSCVMEVNTSGNVTGYKITPSVIRSKKRYTYTEVQEILESGTDELINAMDELREILRIKRKNRGALDFDLPEAKIRVDESGCVISIEPYPRNNATGIIEEFMILCNETIASHFYAKKIPFVYRSHEEPNAEKLSGLQKTMENIGLSKAKRISANTLQNLLENVKGTSAAYAISTAVLHAMPQAYYSSENPTHFGLASQTYCHFTSPIRRYADLQIHRIIKSNDYEPFLEILPQVCTICSRTERVAESLERDVAELKKVQFMANKEGKTFKATISGIVSWGVFVMLENTVEGLIPTANLLRNGFKYSKDQNLYTSKRRKGEKSAKTLQLGSQIKVRLVQANQDERRLTFSL